MNGSRSELGSLIAVINLLGRADAFARESGTRLTIRPAPEPVTVTAIRLQYPRTDAPRDVIPPRLFRRSKRAR